MNFTFNGFEVKQRAWNGLRGCYWNALVLAVLTNILMGIASGVVSRIQEVIAKVISLSIGVDMEQYFESLKGSMRIEDIMTAFVIIAVIFLTSIFIGFAVNTFANEPILVGQKKSYMELRRGNFNIDCVCNGFTKNYKNVVKASALKWMYITIGMLLFYIPGIIFTYRYMMVPYILAENPDIDPQRALSISRLMMKGNKFRAFFFQLSFIGWWLLGAMACFLGGIFVIPYYTMAETELYYELRNQAVASGYVLEAELSGINVID